MRARVDKASGAGGEINPLLYGRTDLEKTASSDRDVQNFVVLPEGARTRRPGTVFVGPLRNENRISHLIPFEAAVGDSYMLVFNDSFMRVIKDGGFVESAPGVAYELPHPFGDADLEFLYPCQSIDVIFIAWNGVPKQLTRINDITWTLTDYAYLAGPVRVQNLDKAKTIIANAVTGNITLTASSPIFLAGHVNSVWRLDEGDLSFIPAWKAIETVAIGVKRRNKGRIYEAVTAGDTGPNPPVHDDGDYASGAGNVTWRFLSESGGYVKITAVQSPISASATVVKRLPDAVVTQPTYRWYEAAWSDVRGWPKSVSLNDQSLTWAASNEFWMSRSSDLYSFELVEEDDSSVQSRINSPDGKLQDIQWMLSQGVLVIGTRSLEWVIRDQNTYGRLTNPGARAIPQSSEGSARHIPAMIDAGAVFIGRARDRLAFAKFDAVTEQIEISDFTQFARHMLEDKACQLANQRDPHRIVWVRMMNGTLNAVTLLPKQEIIAWHRHPFKNAFVEQIACIQSSDEATTELYLIMRREINGQTRRYIEKMQPFFKAKDRKAPNAKGAWYLDCALEYIGTATKLLTGLEHLEGQTVRVFSNGNDLGKFEVNAAQIELPRKVTHAVVGLAISSFIKYMAIDVPTPKGTTKGITKASNSVLVHVHEAAGGQIRSHHSQAWNDISFTGGNPMDAPIALESRPIPVKVDPVGDLELMPEILCDTAMPFTLLSITPDIDVRDS
jgi:hypothetical protein